jgi:hypothetical protein
METTTERLEPKLRESALMVLRRHGIGEDDVRLEENEPGNPASCLIRGHRVRVHLDDRSAAFQVRAGRWSGARVDFPTAGSFIAAFEEALQDALTDQAPRR